MNYKYINGGQERVEIVDRAKGITPYAQRARWIVWNVMTQTVVSEHASKRAALVALEQL